MLEYLILGITYAFASAVQPGPFQTFVISQTLKKGWRSTLPAACAPLISDIPILILVLFMLSRMPGDFILILRITGGLFLLYLGFRAYRSWRDFTETRDEPDESSRRTLWSAVFVNILNPAPYLAWSLIMGPILLEGWRRSPANGIAMVAGFYATIVLTMAGIILLFGLARRFGSRVSRILIGLSALLLFAFGVYQLWLGASMLGIKI